MINLKKLTLKNFLSHTNTELNLEDRQGLILLEGINEDGRYDSNGSGKSTILEGIVYALSGNTLRNVGVNDVVNRKAKKDTCSSLEFTTNNKYYKVNRYRKDTDHGDQLLVSEDDKDISKRLNKDTQMLLDNIIDIPYRVLTSTIVLGEGLSSRFTQLSDPDKKALIESTLNLSYDMNKSRDLANSKMKELKLEISHLDGSIKTLQEVTQLDIKAEVDKLQDYAKSLSSNEAERTTIVSNISELNSKLELLSPKYRVISEALNQVNAYESQIASIEGETIKYLNELQSIKDAPVKVCSLCHQTLSSDESQRAVIGNLEGKISELTENMKAIQSQLSTLPAKSVLDEKYKELYDTEVACRRELQVYNDRLITVSKDITYYTSVINNIQENIANIDKYKEDLDKAQQDRDEKSKLYEKYEYFYKLYSPTGLTTILLEEAISYINKRLKVYTHLLLDKEYHISLVKGKISLVDDKGSTYQSLSNGEKRRLDISIQFSLHDYVHTYCGIKIDSLFVDEILDTLDSTGVNNIIEVLNLKKDYCNLRRVIVITHNSELKSFFDNVITIYKSKDGNSVLVDR